MIIICLTILNNKIPIHHTINHDFPLLILSYITNIFHIYLSPFFLDILRFLTIIYIFYSRPYSPHAFILVFHILFIIFILSDLFRSFPSIIIIFFPCFNFVYY